MRWYKIVLLMQQKDNKTQKQTRKDTGKIWKDLKRDKYTLYNGDMVLRSFIQIRITKAQRSRRTHVTSVFKDPTVAKPLSYLHDYFVLSLMTKFITIALIYKLYYIRLLDKGIRYWQFTCLPYTKFDIYFLITYTPTTPTKEEILANHRSVGNGSSLPKSHKCSTNSVILPSLPIKIKRVFIYQWPQIFYNCIVNRILYIS